MEERVREKTIGRFFEGVLLDIEITSVDLGDGFKRLTAIASPKSGRSMIISLVDDSGSFDISRITRSLIDQLGGDLRNARRVLEEEVVK